MSNPTEDIEQLWEQLIELAAEQFRRGQLNNEVGEQFSVVATPLYTAILRAIQAAEKRGAEKLAREVYATGHNLDCIFCGLKDKRANQELQDSPTPDKGEEAPTVCSRHGYALDPLCPMCKPWLEDSNQ